MSTVGDAYALRNAVKALETDEEPDLAALAWAPIIDNWQPHLHVFPDHVEPGYVEVTVSGLVAGRQHMRDGASLRTSAVTAWDVDDKWIKTQNTLYRLGYRWHERALALRVAEQQNWGEAALFLIAELGPHALQWGGGGDGDVGDFAALEAVHELRREAEEDVRRDWGLGRTAALELGAALKQMGRLAAGRAVVPLTARSRSTTETNSVWYDLKIAAGPDSSDETDALLRGWYRLSKNDYDAAYLNSVLMVDAIAAAHFLSPSPSPSPTKDDGGAPVLPDTVDDGVVVLARLGGIGTERHKEAKRITADVLGKRLPLAPAPDLDAARVALNADFPHLTEAIRMLLGDLRGQDHPLFRPTVLVGPAGAGKTMFVRRLANVGGLPLARFDAGSAWDGMIAGTSKGWTTGHPALPTEALLSRKRGDVLILLDEIEKAGGSSHNGIFANALLQMLERETAVSYPDKYFDAPVDISHVSWIGTANVETGLSEPLRDRLRILHVKEPGIEHLIPLTRSIGRELARESGEDERFYQLDDGDLATVEGLWRGGSVRRLRRIVEIVIRRREQYPRN